MAKMRHAENQLTIDEIAGGGWRLYGWFHGRRIRFQHRERTIVEAKKLEVEQSLIAEPTQTLRMTWLTDAQLRDAEAATLLSEGVPLRDRVEASKRVMVTGEPVLLVSALASWVADLERRRQFGRTVEKNKHRVKAFIAALPVGVKTVRDVTPEHVAGYVFRPTGADYTRLTDLQVIRAWLNFCVRQRWLKVSPCEIDARDLAGRARPKSKPCIITPEQAHALLRAAMNHRNGLLVPYVILSTWCFLRHGEAVRCIRDWLKLDAKTPVIEVDPRKRGTPSYRTVTIPPNVLPLLRKSVADDVIPKDGTVPWTKETWLTVRAAAGLITLGKIKNGRRPILSGDWTENLLRHTGISYFYQRTGDLKETVRQAGNSDDTAFRHYLNLPAEGAADVFYGAVGG